MSDLIRRQDAIDALWKALYEYEDKTEKQFQESEDLDVVDWILHRVLVQNMSDIDRQTILNLPSAQQWIPCSERLPEDIRPVIVTWKNTDPASYYQYIVGKHFTGTACYKNSKWYWYSSTTEDMLAEYGRYDSEEFDEAIECIAWMPLPEAYREGES